MRAVSENLGVLSHRNGISTRIWKQQLWGYNTISFVRNNIRVLFYMQADNYESDDSVNMQRITWSLYYAQMQEKPKFIDASHINFISRSDVKIKLFKQAKLSYIR